MMERIEEFNKYLLLAGYNDVYIQDVDQFLKFIREQIKEGIVQVFDASLIAGRKHLYFAVLNALKAFENGNNISNDLAVECLLYASAQRQIRLAVELLGIKKDSTTVALMVLANNEKSAKNFLSNVEPLIDGTRNDQVLEFSDEKRPSIKKIFGISDRELDSRNVRGNPKKAISELIIENMALLVTQR